jgi:hypothetical protein
LDYRISPDERAMFKRCRRQWDFASPHRRDLEPTESLGTLALPAAVKDALAVYYYPGTWDWQHDFKQSLVHKALRRSLDDAGTLEGLETGTALLDCYDAWAVTVDDFAPVKIEHDVQALVPDPANPERGLKAPDGSAVIYSCRVDLLAVDAADEYWVVSHRLVDDWQSVEELMLDEEAAAACWAWEQDYINMQIAGTIHNEVRIGGPFDLPGEESSATGTLKSVAQHEPSGGGRSIPQHVRAIVRDLRPEEGSRVDQRSAGVLRRTRIRRSRAEIAEVGRLMAAEALDMTGASAPYPNPGPHCLVCEFTDPCLALFAGADPEPLLATKFRPHREDDRHKPRLGQATWGFGRGAAPPGW